MFEWLFPRAEPGGRLAGPRAEYDGEYDPVYGLPKSALAAWLARNPALGKEYEAELPRGAPRSRLMGYRDLNKT
jgi:hypothetical protein